MGSDHAYDKWTDPTGLFKHLRDDHDHYAPDSSLSEMNLVHRKRHSLPEKVKLCACNPKEWFHDTLDPAEVINIKVGTEWKCPVCHHGPYIADAHSCANCGFNLLEEQMYIRSHMRWHDRRGDR